MKPMFQMPGIAPASFSNRRGGAIPLVIVLIACMSILLGGLASAAWQRMTISRSESDRIRALAIAEGGVNAVFDLLATDVSITNTAGPVAVSNYAGGNYTVHLASPAPGIVLVKSHGVYRLEQEQAAASIRVSVPGGASDPGGGGTEPPPPGPPPGPQGPLGNLAVLAGGKLELSGGIQANLGNFGAHGNGSLLLSGGPNLQAMSLSTGGAATLSGNPQVHLASGGGRLHANGPISLRGTINAAEITSSVSAALNWGMTVNGTVFAPVVTRPIWGYTPPPYFETPVAQTDNADLPQLDIETFRDHAIDHDYYYEGNQNITRDWLTADILRRTGINVNNNETLVAPEGGVIFVNGNVTLGQDMRFQGALIAVGNVTIGGSAHIVNPTPYPSVVSVNGNITIGGGSSGPTLDSWIYAMEGNIMAGGGGAGWGMIAKQNVTITAGYAIGDFAGGPLLHPGWGGGEPDPDDDPSEAPPAESGSNPEVALIAWVQ